MRDNRQKLKWDKFKQEDKHKKLFNMGRVKQWDIILWGFEDLTEYSPEQPAPTIKEPCLEQEVRLGYL